MTRNAQQWPPVPLTGDPLDRGDALRKQGKIPDLLAQPNACFVVLSHKEILVDGQGRLALANAAILDHVNPPFPPLFLGLEGEKQIPWFALMLGEADSTADLFPMGGFVGLRSAFANMPAEDIAIAGRAFALTQWHARNGFCPNCGGVTQIGGGGEKRHCDPCDRDLFPRVDPAVIMLVVDGDECLLGRQAHWTPGHYSLLAGFVEPGESFEEACRREVMEESGVKVGGVQYALSQPWPFPHSIMIGQFAEGLSRKLVLEDELEDAIWVSRTDVQAMLAGVHEKYSSPFPGSASNYLLEIWANEYDPF